MLTREVALPLWLALILVAITAWAVTSRVLAPGVRWAIRRRVNRVLWEIDVRLSVRIQPFKLTRRRVLLDRLLFDPGVQAAADEVARAAGRAAGGDPGAPATVRRGDRSGVQRVRPLPDRLQHRAWFRTVAPSREDRPCRPARAGGDPAGRDGRVRHEPPQQHGFCAGVLPRGGAVYVPRTGREYAMEVGLRMLTLRRLVERRNDGTHRAVPAELPVLAYCASSIAHLLGADPPGVGPLAVRGGP